MSQDDQSEPQDYVKALIILLNNLPGAKSRFTPVLIAKIELARLVTIDKALKPPPITILQEFVDDTKAKRAYKSIEHILHSVLGLHISWFDV